MKRTVWAIFIAVFAWNVYRAAATVITPEEAVTYTGYASQPVLKIMTLPYHPSNQVLHSLLCHRVLRLLRVTEFSFRVASLLGLLFYFSQAFQLSRAKPLALLAFTVNPLTVALLPISTGFWMAAGLFLFALRKLLANRLPAAGIALGFAGCFYLTFVIPAFALCLLFSRRKAAINNLFLPAFVILFAFWSIPMVNAVAPVELPLPNRFTAGPSNLARVSRELRDDLRRHPSRPIRVTASPQLVDQLDFYRRRYALGAVQKVMPIGSIPNADYTIVLDSQTGRAKLNATTLVDINQ